MEVGKLRENIESIVNCQKFIVGEASALPLLMLGGGANDAHDAAASDDATFLTDAADGGADFHTISR